MSQTSLSFHHVTFCYDSMTNPIIRDFTQDFCSGWTGIIGVNGAGKTTFLKLTLGLLSPQAGKIILCGSGLYCAQRTDTVPDYFTDFLMSYDGEACRLRGILGIGNDWQARWDSLSFGERKRAQIGVALWKMPALLAVDEPTNHLDTRACTMVTEALKHYTGTGFIVSHDRALLDELCETCLFIDPPELVLRPGGYTQGKAQEEREQATARRLYALVGRERKRLAREQVRRRETSLDKQRKLSKKGLAPKDHDARAKRNLARLSGKDGQGGKLQRQLDGRLKRLEEEQTGIRYKKKNKAGISLQGQRVERNLLFDFSPLVLPLGEARSLATPGLQMQPQDRIGVTGNNGSGKSTLIRYVVSHLTLAPEQLIYIPQELDVKATEQLHARLATLSDGEQGSLMSIISRLGSRPERLLESCIPSPGEARKLLLAFGLMKSPVLVIMDEPTNHLDILSIECMEEALGEVCCGLLLVSHDRRFLEQLTEIRWEITEAAGQPGHMVLRVQGC